jgi:hypothetical protein
MVGKHLSAFDARIVDANNLIMDLPVFMSVKNEPVADERYHKYLRDTNTYFSNGYE